MNAGPEPSERVRPAVVPRTLWGLVRHYSPSGSEGSAVDWLIGHMRAAGFDQAGRDAAGNAVGVRGHGPNQIVLLGHIDTVPGEIPLQFDGERLFGRGTVDAKGPLACFTDAASMAEPGEDWQFVVVGAVEEERDSAGARFVVDQFRPGFLIVGEPSGWDRITLGYKGSYVAALRVRRPAGHPAGPLASAGDQLFETWSRILIKVDELNQDADSEFERISPSIRALESGQTAEEEWAALHTQTRLPLSFSPEDWARLVQSFCEAHGASTVTSAEPIAAYRSEKNSALVRAFLRAIRRGGGRPGFRVKTGTADLNIVAPVWECPAVVYGPGDASLDHTPNEHISIAEYRRAVSVLAEVLSTLTSPPG